MYIYICICIIFEIFSEKAVLYIYVVFLFSKTFDIRWISSEILPWINQYNNVKRAQSCCKQLSARSVAHSLICPFAVKTNCSAARPLLPQWVIKHFWLSAVFINACSSTKMLQNVAFCVCFLVVLFMRCFRCSA